MCPYHSAPLWPCCVCSCPRSTSSSSSPKRTCASSPWTPGPTKWRHQRPPLRPTTTVRIWPHELCSLPATLWIGLDKRGAVVLMVLSLLVNVIDSRSKVRHSITKQSKTNLSLARRAVSDNRHWKKDHCSPLTPLELTRLVERPHFRWPGCQFSNHAANWCSQEKSNLQMGPQPSLGSCAAGTCISCWPLA